MKISQKTSLKHVNTGLLVLRIGIGIMFMFHGLPKLLGGPDMWENIGSSMSYVGIDFLHVFWGFMAGFAEAVGGLFLVLGLAFLPAALMMHFGKGDGFTGYSHALESMILFISLAIIGPGKYRLSTFVIK